MPNKIFLFLKNSWVFLFVALDVWVFDRLTKLAVIKNIPWEYGAPTYHFGGENKPIEIVNGFLYLVHITNEGAAWGILSGQTYLLSSIAIIALAAMWFFRKDLELSSTLGKICAGMFVGGVLGNLADRILYGHVIDFIDVHLPFINYRWPAFNIADCGICIGVVIYIIMVIVQEQKKKKSRI